MSGIHSRSTRDAMPQFKCLTSTAVTAASAARMEGPLWLVMRPRRGSPSPSAWGSMSSRCLKSSHSPADTPRRRMLGSSWCARVSTCKQKEVEVWLTC